MLGLLIVIGFGLVAARYISVVGDVRAVRAGANQLSVQAQRLQVENVDQATVDELRGLVDGLDEDLGPLRDLLAHDPLVGLARSLPPIAPQMAAADSLIDAADALVEASEIGLGLATRVVALREANAADASVAMLPGLVELMATTTDEVDRIGELVATADAALDDIPLDAIGPLLDARDLVADPLATYAPLLDTYREAAAVLPGMLGWGEEKRYLVLAQNPAELRPTGGYNGTVGIIGLRDGAVVERRFQDVHDLDRVEGLPFFEAPEALTNHLLGSDQSWRLADANWSPDFPTSAQKALEFYELQADDSDIDGVIAITTFALDRLLEVVGPVSVDDFDTTVEAGNATIVLLDQTRGGEREGRKEVLDALAREVLRRLIRLPPESWLPMLTAVEDIGEEHMALVWLKDEDAQRFALDSGWAGPVRQDAGDYLFVVEANMAPTSKYNLVVDRSRSHVIKLDEMGDALTSVRLDWQNDAATAGEPYQALRDFSSNQEGWYGSHVRVLVPEDSELIAVNGAAADDVRGAESVDSEAGRAVFANYLLMPPGESTLTYLWTTPGAAELTADGWEYRLVLQKQPGARPEAARVRIDLPDGANVKAASEGAIVDGNRVAFESIMTTDQELYILYDLPGDADADPPS